MTFRELLNTDPREDFAERIKGMTREELEAECLRLWNTGKTLHSAWMQLNGGFYYDSLLESEKRAVKEGIERFNEKNEVAPENEPFLVHFSKYRTYYDDDGREIAAIEAQLFFRDEDADGEVTSIEVETLPPW